MDNVSLYVEKFDTKEYMYIQDACTSIKLRCSFDQISTECNFSYIKQSPNIFKFDLQEGDLVRLYYRRGLIFNGKIINVQDKNGKEYEVSAYDYSWWICKCNYTNNFKNISVYDALIDVYSYCNIPYMIDEELGDNKNILIDKHLVKNKPASQILSAIYSDVTKKTGLYYYQHQRPEDGCVIITEADKYYSGLTIQPTNGNTKGNLINYEINRDISDTITEVRLYDYKGDPLSITGNSRINYETGKEDEGGDYYTDEDIGVATEDEDDDELEDRGTVDNLGKVVNVIYAEECRDRRYGSIIENVIADKNENMASVMDKANKLISDKGHVKNTLSVECIGDIRYQVAMGVNVKIPNTEFYDKFMYITESEWEFNQDSSFIARLELSPSKHHDIISWADIEEKEEKENGEADNKNVGSDLWDRIDAELRSHLGLPYKWAGKSPSDGGMDCSGYVAYCYNKFKNELEITSANGELTSYTIAMMNEGKDVTSDFPNSLVKGDIIFPHSGHVVAYIGDNQYIHEPQTGDVCKISSLPFYNHPTPAKVIRVIPDSAWTSGSEVNYDGETIVTESQLRQLGWKESEYHIDDLNRCLVKNEINTPARLQHFMAQCAHECGCGQFPMELGNGSSAVSGGSKYKGAGAIQLTHDYNYRDFANSIGDERIYTEGCQYVAKNYFWSASGWWWSNNNMNSLCDSGATVEQVTRKVNGGYNGLTERKKYYAKCQEIFK